MRSLLIRMHGSNARVRQGQDSLCSGHESLQTGAAVLSRQKLTRRDSNAPGSRVGQPRGSGRPTSCMLSRRKLTRTDSNVPGSRADQSGRTDKAISQILGQKLISMVSSAPGSRAE